MNTISNVDEYKEVLKNINNNFLSSLYIINSEEVFFLNDFTNLIKKIIPDDLKDLNQYVFFGNEIKIEEIILNAKKFPMLGENLYRFEDLSQLFVPSTFSPGVMRL